MATQTKTPATDFILPNILSLGVAEELREKFVGHLVIGTDMTVDASQVEAITTPCMQVIISAANSLEEAGNCLSIQNPSTAVKNAFEDLGFANFFEKWSMK